MMKKKILGFVKTIMGAFVIIASSALLFNGLTEVYASVELGKKETALDAYTVSEEAKVNNNSEAKETKEDSNVSSKAEDLSTDYNVVPDPLDYYKDKKPTSKDISMEEAAKIGVKLINEVFGKDLSGATIYMGYDTASSSFPRAYWNGDVRFGDTRTPDDDGFSFTIDSVTKEIYSVCYGRTIDENVSLDFDKSLAENPEEYLTMAKELAKKYNLLSGEIKEAVYNCQGYSGNDPDISIDVMGENNEKASILFSRYDKALKAFTYPAMNSISDEANANFEQNQALIEEATEMAQ